jgi:hypothetical protein
MEQLIEEKWDERNWQLALQTEKPVENYLKTVEQRNMAKGGSSIDDLTKEQQDWYRST